MDNNRKIVREKIKKAVDAAFEKKYRKDSLRIIVGLCLSKQMHEKGITDEESLEAALKLIQTKENSGEVINELLRMAGHYDDLY